MAARRGRSQARRNGGNSGGLPGWAWLVLGVLLTLLAMLVLPRYFKSGGDAPFFRPQPNPDAQPVVSAIDEDLPPPPASRAAQPEPAATAPAPTDYDFYTMLPEQEVAMTDAQLAALAREEAERQRRNAQARAAAAAHPDAADPAPLPETAPAPAPAAPAQRPETRAASVADGSRYILQAGAFSTPADAEATKARIALLGLQARVEEGTANGRTVYRVRLGPYATATEMAEAKQKLSNGGLQALAIKAN